MKKLIAMLLAIVMVLSFATVAFAEGNTVDTSVDTSNWKSTAEEAAITLTKVYTVTGSEDETLYPAEKLSFEVTVPDGVTNPDDTKITVDDLTVAGNSNQTININLPVYDTVGVYQYTISEKEGTTQGVEYTSAKINVTVLVTYDYANSKLDTEIVLSTPNNAEKDDEGKVKEGEDGKVDTFTNKYNVGTLTVQKTVSGNLADSSVYFKMTVTLSSTETAASAITVSGGSLTQDNDKKNPTTIAVDDWEYEKGTTKGTATVDIYLKAGDTLTFSNIPDGVSYKVEEDAVHLLGSNETFDPNSETSKQYTATYVNQNGDIKTNETDAAVVNNEKSTSVETGITLDSVPYIVMLAVAACGMVVFMTKKRHED